MINVKAHVNPRSGFAPRPSIPARPRGASRRGAGGLPWFVLALLLAAISGAGEGARACHGGSFLEATFPLGDSLPGDLQAPTKAAANRFQVATAACGSDASFAAHAPAIAGNPAVRSSRRKRNNASSRVKSYGGRGDAVMHGTSVLTDNGWVDTEHTDDVMCRAGACQHEQLGLDHVSRDRVSRVVLATKPEKGQTQLNHLFYMGARAHPGICRQTPGTRQFSCCSKDLWITVPGQRRKVRAGRRARTSTEGCSHMVAVQIALGLLKVRTRPELRVPQRPQARPLPAPMEPLDPTTLFNDAPERRKILPPANLNEGPPSNKVVLKTLPDGGFEYQGPESETSRLLARHAKSMKAITAGEARLLEPAEAFPKGEVAFLVQAAGDEGIALRDIWQARSAELGPGVLLDEEQSVAYLQALVPDIEALLHKVGRTLSLERQRAREGGVADVLLCR